MFDKSERLVAHRCEEILPLLLVVVGTSGSVADDSQAKERHMEKKACMGNGGTLHIASHAVREIALDDIQTLTVSDELVAGTNQSSLES